MPPRAKKPTSMTELIGVNDDVTIKADNTYQIRETPGFLKVGDIVNIVSHGRTLQNYEVLGMDDRFIKFRADMSVAPQTEVVLLPYAQIEAIGLVNER